MSEKVKFDKIVSDGKAIGYLGGRALFTVGPLPGETADVEVTSEKKAYAEARVLRIIDESPHRHKPAEDHYLSCSPWQGVDYGYQLELKKAILVENFSRPELRLKVRSMMGADQQTGYRNKLEFSLLADADKHMELAFHARNSYEDLIPLPDGCILGSPEMNEAALGLLERVNQHNISGYIETLSIRRSQTDGSLIGVVALHQRAKRDWSMLEIPQLAGVVVSLVRSRSQHEVIWKSGLAELTEEIGGVSLTYPFDGFFQTNVDMFEKALADILSNIPPESRVVDLYGGAGTIGLPVALTAREVVGVEINPASVQQANLNAAKAGLANYSAVAVSAERMDVKILKNAEIVIVDPPRAGLHKRVIGYLLDAAPKRIIYLSCNPVTQARDLIALSSAYKSSDISGYDFYPGTLHLESLAVLDRTNAE